MEAMKIGGIEQREPGGQRSLNQALRRADIIAGKAPHSPCQTTDDLPPRPKSACGRGGGKKRHETSLEQE